MIVKFLSHWKNRIILQLSPCWINKGNESLGKFRKVKTKGIRYIKTNSNPQRMKRGVLGLVE
jgi:hypothetical protein